MGFWLICRRPRQLSLGAVIALIGCLAAIGHASAAPAPAAVPQFQDGDVVNFVGDSITHGGRWHTYIEDVYRTRFPERHIQWANTGVSGDTVGQVLARFDADIAPVHANVAVVMLGMNDVGSSLYGPSPTPEVMKQRQALVDRYLSGMRLLIGKLRSSGARTVILVTPSPYDDAAKLAAPANVGRNALLGVCADGLAALAAEMNASLVDFHGPMTTMNQARQASDPTYTLIGADRVHPTAPGSLVMANLFLAAQRIPATVATISMAAAEAPKVEACDRCEVADVTGSDKGMAFSVTERALPTPIDPQALSAVEFLDPSLFPGMEMLRISGLKAGNYRLRIDGGEVAEFSAKQLVSGVNLAALPETPEMDEARKVEALDEQIRQQRVSLRDLAVVRYTVLAAASVDYRDDEATKAYFAKYWQEPKTAAGHSAYRDGLLERYDSVRASEPHLLEQIQKETESLDAMSGPRTHHFEVKRN